jgi:hypothetical protein
MLKLFLLIVFVIIGGIVAFTISVKNNRSRLRSGKSVRDIQQGNVSPEEMTADLEFIFGNRNVNPLPDPAWLKSKIETLASSINFAGRFTIQYIGKINEHQFLVIANGQIKEMVASGRYGELKEVVRIESCRYLVKLNTVESRYEVYSTMFNDAEEKFLHQDFADGLFKHLGV